MIDFVFFGLQLFGGFGILFFKAFAFACCLSNGFILMGNFVLQRMNLIITCFAFVLGFLKAQTHVVDVFLQAIDVVLQFLLLVGQLLCTFFFLAEAFFQVFHLLLKISFLSH